SPTFKNICDKKKNKLEQDDWETMLQSQETKIDIPVQSFEKFEVELQDRYKIYRDIAFKKIEEEYKQKHKEEIQLDEEVMIEEIDIDENL
ncbi:MAG: hypothetical protein IKK93_02455, partial [Campylobacter sp.]|nr:hypothetical protein [Campylobacter sp.]